MAYLFNQTIIDRVIEKSQIIHDDMPRSSFIFRIKQIIQTFFGPYETAKVTISKSIKLIIYIVLSLFVARVFSYYWNDIILSIHQTQFSLEDPIFKKNIGFYVFRLPVLKQILGISKFVAFTILLVTLWNYLKRGYFTLFFSESFRLIRAHVFGLLSLYFLLNSATSFLSKYDILFKNNDIIYGAGYTDIHFYLKAISAFPAIWLLISGISLVFIFKPNIKLIGIAAVVLFIPSFLFLNLIPSLVQNYVVAPNEFKKEVPFIKHNISYTQAAYQLNNITEIDVKYKKMLSSFNDDAFNSTLNNVRLWNPGPLKSTLKQLQEIRLYYEFKNIDIDRYIIDGSPQQVMMSVRELDINQISQQAQTWVNKHLIFTHGYGLCMVPVNQFNDEGLPELYIRDIPPVSKTNVVISQPEVYFGESTNHYVIANTKQKEFDYPKDNENRYTHYNGTGGILLDSIFKRIVYAIKLKDIKLLISQNIHSKSRLMYDRNIHQIPRKIAPFIVYDNDPYIVVNKDGRLIWMIDGYTSSEKFPYSTPYAKQINYIRNSVLVTVDAYSEKLISISKIPKIQSFKPIQICTPTFSNH